MSAIGNGLACVPTVAWAGAFVLAGCGAGAAGEEARGPRLTEWIFVQSRKARIAS